MTKFVQKVKSEAKIKRVVVSAFDMPFFKKQGKLHVRISCRVRRMQHMVVLLVPSGATKYVQIWDPIMTKFVE